MKRSKKVFVGVVVAAAVLSLLIVGTAITVVTAVTPSSENR